MRIHDVTRPIFSGMMVWPGDPEVRIEAAASIEGGGIVNLSRMTLGSHTGTHVDAPRHWFSDGSPIDEIDLGLLIGEAQVVSVVGMRVIGRGDLVDARIRPGTTRLLIRTRPDSLPVEVDRFDPEFSVLSPEAAAWVVERGIRVIGVDVPSVDGADEGGGANHKLFLSRGIVIVEGLDLYRVRDGGYQMCCLPLRVMGGDGAPARVVLVERDRV